MSEFQKVKDPSQKYIIALMVIGLLLFGVFVFSGGIEGGVGAIEVPVNTLGVGTVVSVTSTSQGIRFAERSQVIVRHFRNTGNVDVFIDFGTSTNIENGTGFTIPSSSLVTFTHEQGDLVRGAVYASSSGSLSDNLRLYQYP